MSHSNDSTAAKRIRGLLDKDSFVEIGAFVTARGTDFNLADQETPADGVVTGYGTIDDRLVYVYSQDASVLGGSVGEMHAKKIVRMYEMAMKMGAPVIGLIDCSGLRLQEATDALNAFGELYRCQALANGVVPQIQAVFGTCGAGMAVSAAMADFTFMESENAKIFIHSPNAIEGNTEKDLDNTTAEFQSNESGIADFTGTDNNDSHDKFLLIKIILFYHFSLCMKSFLKKQNPAKKQCRQSLHCLAESQGFEPWVRYHPTHDFQSCALDHSANSPGQRMLTSVHYSVISGFVKVSVYESLHQSVFATCLKEDRRE